MSTHNMFLLFCMYYLCFKFRPIHSDAYSSNLDIYVGSKLPPLSHGNYCKHKLLGCNNILLYQLCTNVTDLYNYTNWSCTLQYLSLGKSHLKVNHRVSWLYSTGATSVAVSLQRHSGTTSVCLSMRPRYCSTTMVIWWSPMDHVEGHRVTNMVTISLLSVPPLATTQVCK